jgi:hypothetical protein
MANGLGAVAEHGGQVQAREINDAEGDDGEVDDDGKPVHGAAAEA